jgi:hypothetical protein
VIRRSRDGLWRSTLLEDEPWLDHAFGTAACEPPEGFVALVQIHSTCIHEASDWRPDLKGDALVASAAGSAVAVKTADCLPILLADPERRVVAAIHAGWRGTVAGIAGAAVRYLADRHRVRPSGLIAAFGPSIGPCCFEVGPDVAPLFQPIFPERQDLHGRTRADLREANARLLESAGVDRSLIDLEGAPCTCCRGSEFHSWRRDRTAGLRMFSVIALR